MRGLTRSTLHRFSQGRKKRKAHMLAVAIESAGLPFAGWLRHFFNCRQKRPRAREAGGAICMLSGIQINIFLAI